jgi:hypothetical protein
MLLDQGWSPLYVRGTRPVRLTAADEALAGLARRTAHVSAVWRAAYLGARGPAGCDLTGAEFSLWPAGRRFTGALAGAVPRQYAIAP